MTAIPIAAVEKVARAIHEALSRANVMAYLDMPEDTVDIAARAAIAAMQPAADGWRPIAEAPRDGTPFDAWVPDAFGGRRMTSLSFNRKGQLRQHGLLTTADLPRWPTHFRPPPAPPVEQPS